MPVPSLPVLSASSCSIQRPSDETSGATTSVSLSRPAFAISPIIAPGARLGAIMGEMAKAGRDKLTLVVAPEVSSLGLWIEQLLAESTGKDGTGILPVAGETLGAPSAYGDDRLFV